MMVSVNNSCSSKVEARPRLQPEVAPPTADFLFMTFLSGTGQAL
jgi:hypothetical protein